ncbi:hypothetical protein KP509_11G016500 [Ceratopteris richardii]|uniref:Conserved oligomeric Golgi complex subunit 5 n=1 Tax=Ceratopteris richardii TaxID=49495 RepID=A0A8T2TT70_CERRI|nr:hypothetical protein KP509_11G016500 [Ceratopteris richardii]
MPTAMLQRSGSSLSRRPSGPSSPMHRPQSLSRGAHHSQHYRALDRVESESVPESADAAFKEFAKDDVFCKFLADNFDVTKFVSDALHSGSVASCSEKLDDGIRLMDRQLRNEVYLRHDELLHLLTSLKDTENSVSFMKNGAHNLLACIQRIRSEIAEPYQDIKTKTRQLSALHSTMELLRFVIKALRQMKRLKEVMGSDSTRPDLAKAAQLYSEVETLRKEGDLSGIDVIDAEIPWLTEAGNKVKSEAMKVLENGMEALNQAEVGSALQVYYNMGELRSTVETMVNKYKNQATKCISIALDMKAISASAGGSLGPGGVQRSGTPHIGGSSKARESLWQRMGPCMDQLHSIVVAVWHLQRVLSKKRDPISHAGFLEEVIQVGDQLLTERVWEGLVKTFTSQMRSSFTASSFIKETFVSGFPKLLSMITNLLERLSRDTDVKGILPAIKEQDREQLLAALEPFQTAYLTQCLNRLSDLVNGMFPFGIRGSIPSQDQVSRFVSRIQEEVEAVKLDERLNLLVLREVGKVLQLLSEKFEYQIATGPESRQVLGPATPVQTKNFSVCLQLQEVYSRINSMLSSMPQSAADVLSPSLGAINGVASDSITPLFKVMVERLEQIILQIHDQNFGSDSADTGIDDRSSKYMEELQITVSHYRAEFLSKLLPSNAVSATPLKGDSLCAYLTRKIASRVLVFYVRHAALVRPLSESGKLRMARDMAELELAIGQNLFPVEQLGAPYRALRAFRPLIFLDTAQLGSSPLLRELPPSVVLHHLYSRGPAELESPLKSKRLTPVQYSWWLDEQTEEQIWKEIKTTLDEYASKVKARGDKEFSPVYPLMLKLGATLVKTES